MKISLSSYWSDITASNEWNILILIISFTLPTAFSETALPSSSSSSSALASLTEWTEEDDGQGNRYWYDTINGISQYENPFHQIIEYNSQEEHSLGIDHYQSTTRTTESNHLKQSNTVGRVQFNNSTSFPPLSVLPEENEVEVEGEVQLNVNASEGHSTTSKMIKSEWGEAYDNEGNIYYYSFVTGISQYESPYV